MITKKIINGEEYLRISDVSKASGVNIRTLQRWLNAGDMVNFLTIYQSENGINYFRLGLPYDTDEALPGSPIIDGAPLRYKLPLSEGDQA